MTCLIFGIPSRRSYMFFFNRVLLRGIIAKHAKTKTKTIRLGGFNHLEQIWKSMGRIIPYMKWKISAMIETTNQYTYCHGKKKHGISHGLVFQPTSGADFQTPLQLSSKTARWKAWELSRLKSYHSRLPLATQARSLLDVCDALRGFAAFRPHNCMIRSVACSLSNN